VLETRSHAPPFSIPCKTPKKMTVWRKRIIVQLLFVSTECVNECYSFENSAHRDYHKSSHIIAYCELQCPFFENGHKVIIIGKTGNHYHFTTLAYLWGIVFIIAKSFPNESKIIYSLAWAFDVYIILSNIPI